MRTILIIDDDPAFLDETQNLFGGVGYRVLKASDGMGAVRLIEEMREEIDLAIVDLSLPDMNGFELIGALSRRPNSVKVIATSGVFREQQLESASALGAHAVIRKPSRLGPLPSKEWLGAVRQLIGEP